MPVKIAVRVAHKLSGVRMARESLCESPRSAPRCALGWGAGRSDARGAGGRGALTPMRGGAGGSTGVVGSRGCGLSWPAERGAGRSWGATLARTAPEPPGGRNVSWGSVGCRLRLLLFSVFVLAVSPPAPAATGPWLARPPGSPLNRPLLCAPPRVPKAPAASDEGADRRPGVSVWSAVPVTARASALSQLPSSGGSLSGRLLRREPRPQGGRA